VHKKILKLIVKKEFIMQPKIAQKAPYAVEVVAGQSYYWCSCGQSKKQPI
jgi:CDGSH-type Zn-finger protein